MSVVKKTTRKVAPEKTPRGGKSQKAMKGDTYTCNVCGLVVSVDTVCECIDACNILCCEKPMKLKKKRA